MNFWEELKRRNVFRVAAAYAVMAWLLVQVAETVLPLFDVPDVFLRGVVLVLALGFPLAVFLAWAFELTPGGIKRDRASDRDAPASPASGRRLDRVILVVLAAALGFFFVDRNWLTTDEPGGLPLAAERQQTPESAPEGSAKAAPKHSLAVMAFDDMSREQDQEYLADGIAEELLNLLARVPQLRLTSRTSSFAFEDKDVPLRRIAEQLGVAYILQGSVRKAGNEVRITAQLVDARNDSQVWSRSYDRKLDDIFAIQDEIAASVVGNLRLTLLGDSPTVEQVDPKAYDLFLRGRHLANLSTEESLEQARVYFQRALEIEPDYADARLGLAVIAVNQVAYGVKAPDEVLPKARARIKQVLSAHPQHAQANSLMGWFLMSFDNDWAGAAARFEKSLASAPANHAPLSNAIVLLHALGRLEQAIELYEYVVENDPLNHHAHVNLAGIYLNAGRVDDAITKAKQALQISPGALSVNVMLGRAYLQKGDPRAAAEAFRNEGIEAGSAWGLALVAHELGQRDEFEKRRNAWLKQWGERYPVQAAVLFAYAGNKDKAFEWLERIEPGQLTDSLWYPELASLHDDPRWNALLKRHGLAPRQQKTIEFDIDIPES